MDVVKKRNYYTAKEVRELVYDSQISLTTLHKLMNSGKIPFIQFCRKRLIPASWVDVELEKAHIYCNVGQGVSANG